MGQTRYNTDYNYNIILLKIMRKHRLNVIITFILYAGMMWLAAGCSGGDRSQRPGERWATGSEVMDSLLSVADSLDWNLEYDERGMMKPVLARIMNECRRGHDTRLKAVALALPYLGVCYDGRDAEAWRKDSAALALLNTLPQDRMPEYLRNRIRLSMAQRNPDIQSDADALYELLPYFKNMLDSISVINTLFELQNSYSAIWDDETAVACMREMLRWVPAADPGLRDVINLNLLSVDRGTPDAAYLHTLDSMRNCKELFNMAPSAGIVVFTDLYIIRGRDADLDTAGYYASQLPGQHESFRIYAAQRIRQAMKGKPCDSIQEYVAELRKWVDDPTNKELETLPILIDYYRMQGDSASVREVKNAYDRLKSESIAYQKSTEMAGIGEKQRWMNMDKEGKEKQRKKGLWLWLAIPAGILLLLGGWRVGSVLTHRRHHETTVRMNDELESARRRLTVAQLQETEVSQNPEDWERFKALFVEMRPDFEKNIKARFPGVTAGDLRLCAMLYMKMETKHIARLLNINPDSVKKHKQRLRAKLGMNPDMKWDEFLSQF